LYESLPLFPLQYASFWNAIANFASGPELEHILIPLMVEGNLKAMV
jgi:hypothetical protein